MNSNTQSTLARLLAKENITIQHGNFSTAFFDVKHRVLGLPNWKDKGKDVYDLLVGHEVGHALFTPADFVEAVEHRKIRQDYLNLVEDARIERMIQNQYPGLIGCFRRGYAVLKNDDFFGLRGRDVNSLDLPDRLNIKFKLGNLIDIKFSPAEQAIFNQIESAQSFDEVVNATIALQDYMGKQKKAADKLQKQIPQPKQDQDNSASDEIDPTAQPNDMGSDTDESQDQQNDTDASGSDDSEDSSDDSDDNSKPSGESTDDAEENDDKTDSNDGDDARDEQDSSLKNSSSSSNKPADADAASETNSNVQLPAVNTQENFDQNAKKLLDTDRKTLMTAFPLAPTAAECMENVIPYAKLAEMRKNAPQFTYCSMLDCCNQAAFKQFLTSTKKVVATFAKEFELRKAAYQYSRASVSKTGSLNLEKLHAYRVSDDLFLSVTKLANAKNHGMVMFVDYSGSMTDVLPHVLKHLINMVLFCKMVGIPFQVYGFTSGAAIGNKSVPYYQLPDEATQEKIILSSANVFDLINSDLSKSDFNAALYALWLRSVTSGAHALVESLGGTPLNETLIIAHEIVNRFRASHPVDKMNVIFLTDGAGNHIRIQQSTAIEDHKIKDKSVYGQTDFGVRINGRYVKAPLNNPTPALIQNLRATTNSEVIGFFIPSSRGFLRQCVINGLTDVTKNYDKASALWFNKYEKIFKEEDVISIPGAYNYSNYFVVASGNDLAIDDEDEIEIEAGMSRGRMARIFTNYSKSKKGNRVFVTKFAEAIA